MARQRDPRELKHKRGHAHPKPANLPPERREPETMYLVEKGTQLEVRTKANPIWRPHVATKNTTMHTTGRKGKVLYLRFAQYEARLTADDNLSDKRFPRYEAPKHTKHAKFAPGPSTHPKRCEFCDRITASDFVLPLVRWNMQLCETCQDNVRHFSGKLASCKALKKHGKQVSDEQQVRNAVQMAKWFKNNTLASTIAYAKHRLEKGASRGMAEPGRRDTRPVAVSPVGPSAEGATPLSLGGLDESPRPRPEGVFPTDAVAP